jgi:formiminoglutamase
MDDIPDVGSPPGRHTGAKDGCTMMKTVGWASNPLRSAPRAVWEDVDEHRVTRWIREWRDDEPVDAALMGAPFTSANAKPTGSWAAPQAIRAAFDDLTTYNADFDIDLFELRVADAGDILVDGMYVEASLRRIQGAVSTLLGLQPSIVPVVFGGDHSVTAATVQGYAAARGGRVGLIYFDSHTDVRAAQEGVALAGSPVRSILEGCPAVSGSNVVEIGLHGFMNASRHRAWLEDRGGRVVSARQVRRRGIEDVVADAVAQAAAGTDSIYVSVDLDVLRHTDGVGAGGRISPDGMDVIDLIEAMFSLGSTREVGMLDVVELDPRKDVAGTTARVAASLALTFLAGLLNRLHGGSTVLP